MNELIVLALFASFPEALLILIIGLTLTNCKCITAPKCLIGAAVQSIVSIFIGYFKMSLELHSIFYLISYYLIFVIIFKIDYKKAVFPLLIGALFQGFIQSLSFSIGTSILNWSMASVRHDIYKTLLLSVPSIAISLIIVIVTFRKKIIIWDINN